MRIRGGHVHPPIGNERCRANTGVFGLRPDVLAGLLIYRQHMPIARRYVDYPVGHSGRVKVLCLGVVLLHQLARGPAYGIDIHIS